MKASFTVYGEPLSQKRHRSRIVKTRDGREFISVYDDPKSRKAKESLAVIVKQQAPERLLVGPLKVDITFWFGRPMSHYGTGRNSGVLKKSADRYKWKKPDRDNLDKLVLDAMSGIVFHDDAQACGGSLWKYYTSDRPRIEIRIEELEPPVKKLFDPLKQLKGKAGGKVNTNTSVTGKQTS